jgi:cytochrome c553
MQFASLMFAVWCAASSNVILAVDDANFDSQVAPALSAKCVACHRPENSKGGLDLTTLAGALQGGHSGPAIVVREPDQSALLLRAIAAAGERPEMPAEGEPLTNEEAAAVRQWIADGAAWPDGIVLRERSKADGSFWSLQPVVSHEPPQVPAAPRHWASHPIDRFIFAGMEDQGLVPNSPADPATFIRRATFDLIGLPPTPEEIAAFEHECQAESSATPDPTLAPAAVERLIDRLLASPHYGERWGRHWLDVIRFGESRGYERNEIITNLWPFRDYIIRSFNEDKPFDQLVREHLAGDVIGPNQPDIEVGSAFLVAGPYDDVGNQDAAAAALIRADQMDEMIRATGEAFLGLTIGCARCHDHKFDPLLQRDYYAMYATFAGTVHGPREVATVAARQKRMSQLEPLQKEREAIVARQAAHDTSVAERAAARAAEAEAAWIRPAHSRYLTEEMFEPHDAAFVRLTVEGTDSADGKATVFKLDEFEVWTDSPEPRNAALAGHGAIATGAAREPDDFAGAYSAALTIDGRFGERWHAAENQLLITLASPQRIGRVVFSSDRTQSLAEDHSLTVFVGDYRIETSLDAITWREVASSRDRQPKTSHLRQERLQQLATTEEDREVSADIASELAQVDAAIGGVPQLPGWWVGTHQPLTEPATVFHGGNPQRRGDPVLPSSIAVLNHLPSKFELTAPDEAGGRLRLAEWITSPDNPLTSRVLANRLWQYHFGRGIVETPSDFGYLGSRPTHPELLDWLASEVVRGGWKLKPLHRWIMTSQTYQQSGRWNETAGLVDAESRLLWRFPPRRLNAEEVRDTLLAVAGVLKPDAGGPGFRLYEYQQDNVATYVPLDVHGPETYRRSVYHHNARSSRVDMLTDFDCPDPAFAEPRRAVTTTPLQALTMLNHQFPLEMATQFAARLERDTADRRGQIVRAFSLTFGRAPTETELNPAMELVEKHGLRSFCRALLNANELITVN